MFCTFKFSLEEDVLAFFLFWLLFWLIYPKLGRIFPNHLVALVQIQSPLRENIKKTKTFGLLA
jgi:hypothetical protein